MKQHSKLVVNLIFVLAVLPIAGVLFATGYYPVHIEVKAGAARFVDSPCPDHICESFGWLSAEDQTATCLPARAVLTIAPLS